MNDLQLVFEIDYCFFFIAKLYFLMQNVYSLDGKFGAMMQVHIQNDGPVTIEIESPLKKE